MKVSKRYRKKEALLSDYKVVPITREHKQFGDYYIGKDSKKGRRKLSHIFARLRKHCIRKHFGRILGWQYHVTERIGTDDPYDIPTVGLMVWVG